MDTTLHIIKTLHAEQAPNMDLMEFARKLQKATAATVTR